MAKKKKPTQEMMTTMRVSHFLDPYQEYWTYGMLGLEILEQFVQPPDPCFKAENWAEYAQLTSITKMKTPEHRSDIQTLVCLDKSFEN